MTKKERIYEFALEKHKERQKSCYKKKGNIAIDITNKKTNNNNHLDRTQKPQKLRNFNTTEIKRSRLSEGERLI